LSPEKFSLTSTDHLKFDLPTKKCDTLQTTLSPIKKYNEFHERVKEEEDEDKLNEEY
jgi:hypothetical protein